MYTLLITKDVAFLFIYLFIKTENRILQPDMDSNSRLFHFTVLFCGREGPSL